DLPSVAAQVLGPPGEQHPGAVPVLVQGDEDGGATTGGGRFSGAVDAAGRGSVPQPGHDGGQVQLATGGWEAGPGRRSSGANPVRPGDELRSASFRQTVVPASTSASPPSARSAR